jgi:hypothetical protein
VPRLPQSGVAGVTENKRDPLRGPAESRRRQAPDRTKFISGRRRDLELCTCTSDGWCWVCADRRQEQYEYRKANWEIARAAARAANHAENNRRGLSSSDDRRVAHQLVLVWGRGDVA